MIVVEVKVADLVRNVPLMKNLGSRWALRFKDLYMSYKVTHCIEVFVLRQRGSTACDAEHSLRSLSDLRELIGEERLIS